MLINWINMLSLREVIVYIIIIGSLISRPAECLANCPNSCTCDDETLVVKCGEGHLDVLPIALNPSIQRLVIKSNKIKTIDSSIQFYAELTFLDLSYNHLFNIPSRTFAYQKKLQQLHLNHNKIGAIDNKTFIGLNSLTVLNMRGNLLDKLDAGIFSSLPELEELNLGQNRINQIDSRTFEGLINLRVIYLDDNTLTMIPSQALGLSLPRLAELFLGTNSFPTIPRDTFKDLQTLTRLDLHGAGIQNISRDSLNNLKVLRILDLSDNQLYRIPTIELSTLNRLEDLTLGQNDFEIIPEGAFVGLNNLKRIDISGAHKLKRIESGAFATNTNLESLTLTSNKMLTELQEGALSGLPHLKHVILRDNALKTLAEGIFPWKELHTLDLSENPITCDCRMLWLRNILLARNGSNTMASNILCHSPRRLMEEPLRTLTVEHLGCSHNDPRRQALIGALLVGCAATITALALIIYRCRRKIREVVKGGWGTSALGRKEREYQKTFSDEDYIARHHPHTCGFGIHPTTLADYSHHVGLRPIPVTEL